MYRIFVYLCALVIVIDSCVLPGKLGNLLPVKSVDTRTSLLENNDGIPISLIEGATGSGAWLSGIKRRPPNFAPDNNRIALLEDYKKGLVAKSKDADLNFTQLVNKNGYPIENYEVKTDDGYLLTVFRIPYGAKSPLVRGTKKPVVFLMHGLIDSSDNWIIMGPQKGLAYILADAGYDVWLGNARGNTHSRKHTTIKPSDNAFWEFSWDEIGRYDLPAMIDFALNKTGEKKLYYVGHSQGTTSFFVMCSMRPEYNAKIRIMFALAPIAWMSNMISPIIRLLSPATKEIDWVTKTLGIREFLPSSRLLSFAGGFICEDDAITQDLCSNTLFMVAGYNVDQMNTTMLPTIMGHVPAGSSVRQFLHYGQEYMSQKFCRYDFGDEENKLIYGTVDPPNYNVTKITSPVALFYSENDWLSHPKDVNTLSKQLGNMVDLYKVPHPKFNHMDYIWAKNATNLVYDRIMRTMPNY